MAISNKMKSGFRKIGDKFNKLTSSPSSSTEVAPSHSPSMDFSLAEDLNSGDETDHEEVGVVLWCCGCGLLLCKVVCYK